MDNAARAMNTQPVTQASRHSWCNGQIGEREHGAPSIASISLHLGTSVFDGMMAYWNRDHYYVHRAEDHLVRFRQGAARMGMTLDWSVGQMLTGIDNLLRLEPSGTQYIRPIAFRGAPELWVTGSQDRPVDVSIFTVRTQAHRDADQPITCHVSPIERISSRSMPSQVKVSGSYVNSFLARRTAELDGFDDGIMLDRHGHLAEASAANMFVIADGRLVTPRLTPEIFPGITRQTVLELARDQGIDVQEAELSCENLTGIDGAFLSSTLMELRAVSAIGDQPLCTLENAIYKAVLGAFRSITHQ